MKYSTPSFSRLISVGVAVVAMHACTATPSEPVIREKLTEVEATVERIDPVARIIDLRGPNGAVSIFAGPDVRNFDTVKVGDKVKAGYYEALAAQIKKKGTGATETTEVNADYRAPKGDKPGVAVGRSVTVPVKIESVDKNADIVSFRTPDGALKTVVVQAPNMKEFARTLKKGDEVELTFIDAFAIEVVPAK